MSTGSLLLAVLILIALKYVFRPPAIRMRFCLMFLAPPVTACLGAFLLLR